MSTPLAAVLDLDTHCMLRVREGDEACLGLLVERHRNSLVGFFYRMVQNHAVAEELAQETFLRVFNSRRRYEPSARFTTWLYRIATNLALNWLRDHRAESRCDPMEGSDGSGLVQLADQRPVIDRRLVRHVEISEVRRAIASLPERQRTCVILHKYEGFSYAQIAEAMNTSEQAIRSLAFRAYEVLRQRLAHLAP